MLFLACSYVCSQNKREFRGAWIQAVNGQWLGVGKQKMQETLTYQLNELQKDGVNAIIFQVRPECDALYQSSIEPWSRFLTGKQGVAPSPYWDPLQWMVTECHKRGMELHAWINPYRAKTKTTHELDSRHVAIRHPEWVFEYDDQYILNPAIPECRNFICHVVGDIVRRYDVDGLHIDDYFYPYPAAGQTIPDDQLFRSNPRGFTNKGDWRRDNVNLFIRQLSDTIHQNKPWVKFGVSPFGIYRNKKNDPNGSNTNGLQNYDDLYADVLLWVNKGWVDYNVPQLYWEIGHKSADYQELIGWWNRYASNRPLFIGEDVERTVKNADLRNPNVHQLAAKVQLRSQMRNVQGAVLWYAKAAVDNIGNYGTSLRSTYWRYPALQPKMDFIDGKAPKKVRKPKVINTQEDGNVIFWREPKGKGWKNQAVRYVVYRFNNGERINIDDPSHIVAITPNTFYRLPARSQHSTYVITALDQLSNESKIKKVKY
ncbi:MAG: family 10 glycosylhydrolase [Prevotella sp.]|nr:family 10 glycosylhydrolase [Prevotella sp.]MBP5355251.1 family 10 glycosylhydrolase [Prevotella sp.]